MYEKILVPLDGSAAAEIVLPYVEEIGAMFSDDIALASVAEPPAADLDHLYRSYLEGITEQIERQLKEYAAKKELRVYSKILLGKPADGILHYADEINASLIVMASRGSSGQGPWLLGSVAAKVIRATSRPVLLVRAPCSSVALQQKKLIKRVLVPLDGSKTGEAALPYAEALAWALGAEMVLFRVVEPTLPEPPAPLTSIQEVDAGKKAVAIVYLDGVSKTLMEKGLRASTATAFGYSADEILNYVAANAIDLIAMSAHGRTGIGRWVLGSVTDKVLHAGDTAVLVVRTAKVQAGYNELTRS